MCVCLRALCAEEQVRSLSSLLDLPGQSFDAFRLDYYPDDPGPNGVSPRSHMKLVRDICQGYAARDVYKRQAYTRSFRQSRFSR